MCIGDVAGTNLFQPTEGSILLAEAHNCHDYSIAWL